MKRKQKEPGTVAAVCQLRNGDLHPFGAMRGFVPLGGGEELVLPPRLRLPGVPGITGSPFPNRRILPDSHDLTPCRPDSTVFHAVLLPFLPTVCYYRIG